MPRANRQRYIRRQDLKRRAGSAVENFMPRCAILGCGRPTMRAAKQGLDAYHCRFHVDHKARHGSHWHKSYRATDLKPYLAAAALWIAGHRSDPWVTATLASVHGLMEAAGHAAKATELRGRPPRERARIALARLREAGVKPERLLAIHLAVSALIKEDPGSHRVKEFRIVQTAKAAHRLASGYHQSWDVPLPDGRPGKYEIHAYPRSSGRVLRHLGEMIEDACDHVTDRHLSAVLALKVERDGRHPAIANPKPTPFALPPERRRPSSR